MKKVVLKHTIAITMAALLSVTSVNFSLVASATDSNSGRIVGFKGLGDDVTNQTLPLGASLKDVVLPSSLTATVEELKQVETLKLVERTEISVPAEDAEELPSEEQESVEDETGAEAEVDKADSVIGENTDMETILEEPATEEPIGDLQDDGAVQESEALESESESPEESDLEENVNPESDSESIDTGLIDLLFPAIVAHAAGTNVAYENSSSFSGAMAINAIEPAEKYETVIETHRIESEIIIGNVEWKIKDGKIFDTSVTDQFVFEPKFNTSYVVAAPVPTITVNIVNTSAKVVFEKSKAVEGVEPEIKTSDDSKETEAPKITEIQSKEDKKDKASEEAFEVLHEDKRVVNELPAEKPALAANELREESDLSQDDKQAAIDCTSNKAVLEIDKLFKALVNKIQSMFDFITKIQKY